MKRCIKAHTVASFGLIPVGSLWADDSPYVTDEASFVDADTPDLNGKAKALGLGYLVDVDTDPAARGLEAFRKPKES